MRTNTNVGVRFKKGHITWNKGISCSDKTKQKIRDTKRKNPNSVARFWLGKKRPDIGPKISAALRGKFVGEKNPFCGKKHSEESIKKMIKTKKLKYTRPDVYTCLEEIMRDRLIKEGREFVHNKRIGRYVVDFLLPDENHIIEVDGYFHKFDDPEKVQRRDLYLTERGFTVEHVPQEVLI